MLPYWLLFAVWAAASVQTERRRAQDPRLLFFVAAITVTALLIGLRLEVGGDWFAYTSMYEEIYFQPFWTALGVTDPGYAFVNWLAIQFGVGIWFVNLVCSALFMGGIAHLAWRQPNPALAILVAVPYFIIVVAMGYTRQAAAIGLVCLAITSGSERRLLRMIALIGAAALFHKTALLILPIALRPIFQRNFLFGVFGVFVFGILFVILLQDSSDQLLSNYVNSTYDSQGALIRVMMNVVAAILFIILHKRMDIPPFQDSFWVTCAVLALVSVLGLATAAASSGIDRISLYFIPLQMIAYAHLPYVLNRSGKAQPSILIAVIGYSVAVQYVWLFYADNASSWLPYRWVLE